MHGRYWVVLGLGVLLGSNLSAAEVHWQGVRRAAQGMRPEQAAGETATLDALEKRAAEALARIPRPTDRAGWEKTVPHLRQRLTEALGIDRLPPARARNVQQVGILDRGDHVIEKLTYETLPGCPVAAHLYRPAQASGRLPTILFAPGHLWSQGKAHPDIQAFGATMARWGFLVLVYDPHGEGERGISMRDHRRTELLLAGVCQQAIPVFESRCALEYLLRRKDVDAERLGITGESGGGYNSWIMAALEPRVRAAVPVVGTSEFLEQVQVCRGTDFYLAREHCHFIPGLLRFANNHEYVTLAAPKPVLVIAADNDLNFRLPGIRKVVAHGRQLYQALAQPERIGYFEDTQTGHGYQKPKRQAAYGWFRRWLQNQGQGEPIPEPNVDTLPWDAAELRCFPAGKNQPAGPALIAQVQKLLDELPAQGAAPTAASLRTALAEALGVQVPDSEPKPTRTGRRVEGGAVVERLEWHSADEVRIPALLVGPTDPWRGVLLACGDAGMDNLLDHAGVRAAVAAGLGVVLVDVRGVGELATKKAGWVFATSLLLGENFVGRQALDLVEARRLLAALPESKGKSVGLLGVGPFAAQAALYAATLEDGFDWLVVEGGYVSYRSFVDRPQALQASYRLAATVDSAWDVIDREIPATLFVFDVLRRFDLSDLLGARADRPLLVVAPRDGDGRPLADQDARDLLARSRFRWPRTAATVAGDDTAPRLRAFVSQRVR